MRHTLAAIFGVPAGLGGVYLLGTQPRTKRQNMIAAGILVYFVLYYLIFIR